MTSLNGTHQRIKPLSVSTVVTVSSPRALHWSLARKQESQDMNFAYRRSCPVIQVREFLEHLSAIPLERKGL